MAIINFPPIENADENGIVAVGGDLEVPSLKLAYSKGIFPWPISSEFPLVWFSPDPRGILEFKDLHISRSTKKIIKKNQFLVKFNTNFEQVIINCAGINNRKGEISTWITDDIIKAYINLFNSGYAYSVESYYDDELVGGVYGVCINGFVSGESMFYKIPNASKVALIHLMKYLNSKGISWLDTQMITSVVENLGGKEIPRSHFLKKLQTSKQKDFCLFDW